MSHRTTTPQTAVWYFVGATFMFVSPTLIFQGSDLLWLRLLTLVAGLITLTSGILVWTREQRQRRAARDADSPEQPGRATSG
ncbi:hypothetical protein RCH23_003241 [Cryobacterium sp. CAN_C3]|uniref:hypothetical protein n=1 Tax=unclassified Cryobacterium TaxID=2649013 RepID=UPI0018CA6453|nr:hypothetical protein [Cryobacterium sp. CAN_C3]MEC5155840.1 hypothetical protein [Cryobacterium sp. CAN_C3]